MRRALVAIDRDGTIIKWVHHLTREEEMELLPGAGRAIAELNAARIIVAVYTNQSVVGRGKMSLDSLKSLHERLSEMLSTHGAHVDFFLICPHTPSDRCSCRKPSPTLLTDLMERLGVDSRLTAVIGDTDADIGAARNAGVAGLRVMCGRSDEQLLVAPAFPDLEAAVNHLLGSPSGFASGRREA